MKISIPIEKWSPRFKRWAQARHPGWFADGQPDEAVVGWKISIPVDLLAIALIVCGLAAHVAGWI